MQNKRLITCFSLFLSRFHKWLTDLIFPFMDSGCAFFCSESAVLVPEGMLEGWERLKSCFSFFLFGRRYRGRRLHGGRLQLFFFSLCVLCWRNVESAGRAQWQAWNQSVREAKRVKMKRELRKRGRSLWGISCKVKGNGVIKRCVLGLWGYGEYLQRIWL